MLKSSLPQMMKIGLPWLYGNYLHLRLQATLNNILINVFKKNLKSGILMLEKQ